MNTAITFIAGLAVGVILGCLLFLGLYWLARNLPKADDLYYNDHEPEYD